jgi:hypothetical protein
MVPVVDCLFSKYKSMSSNPSTARRKGRKRKAEGREGERVGGGIQEEAG